MLDWTRLGEAFGLLGEDLARRGLFLELAVYGGRALALQFDWRQTTQDVVPCIGRMAGKASLTV